MNRPTDPSARIAAAEPVSRECGIDKRLDRETARIRAEFMESFQDLKSCGLVRPEDEAEIRKLCLNPSDVLPVVRPRT